MRQKSGPEKQPAEEAIKDIRRATRRHFSAEEKIRIVLEGLRREESVAELCRGAQGRVRRWRPGSVRFRARAQSPGPSGPSPGGDEQTRATGTDAENGCSRRSRCWYRTRSDRSSTSAAGP